MKRIELATLIGILIAVAITSFTAFAGECEAVRGQVLRLHILANSDSEADQALKLAVRDAVLAGTREQFSTATGKLQIEAEAAGTLPLVEALAAAALARQGCDYGVRAEIVNMYFETRTYDGVTLPAGHYDAVRVTIGEGNGKNWWCVMFPPMCIPAAAGDDGAALEEQIIQLGRRPHYEPKFAVVELVESIKEHFIPGRSQKACTVF